MSSQSVPVEGATSTALSAVARTAAAPLFAAAAAVLAYYAADTLFQATTAGPLTRHMGLHILLMNVAAPALAAASLAGRRHRPRRARGADLAAPTVLQLVLLFGWHTPGAMAAAHAEPVLGAAAMISLGAVAAWFWYAILDNARRGVWPVALALMVTAKLYCFLAALVAFAGRPLYAALHGAGAHSPGELLADQQFAGMMMLVACPATYVLAAILFAIFWFRRSGGWRDRRGAD